MEGHLRTIFLEEGGVLIGKKGVLETQSVFMGGGVTSPASRLLASPNNEELNLF